MEQPRSFHADPRIPDVELILRYPENIISYKCVRDWIQSDPTLVLIRNMAKQPFFPGIYPYRDAQEKVDLLRDAVWAKKNNRLMVQEWNEWVNLRIVESIQEE